MEATALALDAGTLSTFGAALHQAGGGEFTRESYLAEHLPYFALAADDVMVLREGDLMATLRLDGLNPMTTEDARLDALKRAVAAIVAQTGNAFGFYRITLSRNVRRSRHVPLQTSRNTNLNLIAVVPQHDPRIDVAADKAKVELQQEVSVSRFSLE